MKASKQAGEEEMVKTGGRLQVSGCGWRMAETERRFAGSGGGWIMMKTGWR